MEFRLLVYFVENMNIVLSKEQLIEDVLRQEALEDDKNTLRVHIKYLREKIEDDISNPRYIQTVRKSGYRFVGERN